MNDPINGAEFLGEAGKKSKRAAMGYNPKEAAGKSNGGIADPIAEDLKLDQIYFRFLSSKRGQDPKEAPWAGAWWIDYETILMIHDFAKKHSGVAKAPGLTHGQGALSYAAALHLAIPPEWGNSYYLVAAQVRQPLRAWSGHGSMVKVRNSGGYLTDRYIPLPDLTGEGAKQYYVPGEAYVQKGMSKIIVEQAAHFLRRDLAKPLRKR